MTYWLLVVNDGAAAFRVCAEHRRTDVSQTRFLLNNSPQVLPVNGITVTIGSVWFGLE
ncbi:hypothetical protein [Pseudohongiella spirulinae]|uniref:Uncharacterized protein n=1 Tax=Pseudohongiella spirulinae TaxID=1249552 RepID=A0A0S2KBD1_9GAMM|nr:hypothetical protein [Pseudohongiella spirulinae]ALO45644.1 hypothetical protein PS2015_975 [Pseudohongiella spirulinae]